ncbi:hypothetical protein AB0H82_17065 [Streptomyces sp. NPDC050732]|uniref:hypothetical protein n=1 Tax=Streptomyces sp. NPDC050732 TaxID=3154632 RepID=UPI00341E7CD7
MKSTVSRAVMAASVTVALGLTAACGSDNGDSGKSGDNGKKASGKPAAVRPAAKKSTVLTTADLEKAALVKGDLKGYKVEKMSAADMPAQTVPADPAACQPLADMFMFAGRPTAKARVGRTVTSTDELDATVISFALLAHEKAAAEKVMDGLRTATKKCTSYEHAGSEYRDVAALAAPKTGDEAVSYKVVGDIEGQKTPMSFTVVRSGPTVAAFYSINLLKPKKFGVPTEIVEAQVKKLEKTSK